MKPFRNSGWPYYDKVQAILPNASARGSHAFSALGSIHDTMADEGIDETASRLGNVASGSGGGVGSMDVDRAP